MTDSQPSDIPKNLEELSTAIDQLEKNLDSISRSQSSGRTTVLIGSLLLLAMIGFFGINLFRTLKTQINEETLQAALQEKADELLPTLQDKFTKAAMEAVPTYRELALKRLKTLRPKLQAMITEEAKSLSNRIPVMLQEKANQSLQRVT
ncbi:MAG TPA: hypothetical protein DEB70_05300, partial [Planctomycetaceae bacterium]|nr:hypothetical protein [Planctomycetaceae bacterium]